MRTSAHGEFLRVLVENGAIGLVLYMAIWIAAIARLGTILRQAVRRRLMDRSMMFALPIVLSVPAAIYVDFEAAGTHAFVVLVFVSLQPEFSRVVIDRRRRSLDIQSRDAKVLSDGPHLEQALLGQFGEPT